jgi:hypothetical protein
MPPVNSKKFKSAAAQALKLENRVRGYREDQAQHPQEAEARTAADGGARGRRFILIVIFLGR